MKKTCIYLIFSMMTTLAIASEEKALKKAQKEAEKFAKQEGVSLEEHLSEQKLFGFVLDDLLPDNEKGQTFNAAAAEKQCKEAVNLGQQSEHREFLTQVIKKESSEEGEEFLFQSQIVIQNPYQSTDISALQATVYPEEEVIQTCEESGTYQVSTLQKLSIEVIPEVKQTVRHCLGHEQNKEYFWKSDAKTWKESKEKGLSKHVEIASYEVEIKSGGIIKDYKVVAKWKHHDNSPSCGHFSSQEKIVSQGKETDHWQSDDPETLTSLESNPFCKLLYIEPTQGPSTRLINGKAITRDIWERALHFSCEPSSESKCEQIRLQGGILIEKRCLQENLFGECDTWEKTYDLGKRAAYQKNTASFKNEEIWGLTTEFDTTYLKNSDLAQTAATLSIFADLKDTLETDETVLNDKVEVFKGEKSSCERSFVEGQVFDCCRKMNGIGVAAKLAKCTSEEKCLAERREQGKCHYIGSHKIKLGTITEQVYCCFPTKLARIIHEQGRKQLKIKWGSVSEPKCQGLKLKELQNIDFGKIDLSEVTADLKIDKKAYAQKLRGNLDQLKTKVQAEIHQKSLEYPDKPLNGESL